jgi:hypothetical protein
MYQEMIMFWLGYFAVGVILSFAMLVYDHHYSNKYYFDVALTLLVIWPISSIMILVLGVIRLCNHVQKLHPIQRAKRLPQTRTIPQDGEITLAPSEDGNLTLS